MSRLHLNEFIHKTDGYDDDNDDGGSMSNNGNVIKSV